MSCLQRKAQNWHLLFVLYLCLLSSRIFKWLLVNSEITDGVLQNSQSTGSFKYVVWRKRLSQEGVNKMNPREKGNETLQFLRFFSLAGNVSKDNREPTKSKFILSSWVQMNNPIDTSHVDSAPLLSWLHLRFQRCVLAAVCQISLYVINSQRKYLAKTLGRPLNWSKTQSSLTCCLCKTERFHIFQWVSLVQKKGEQILRCVFFRWEWYKPQLL